MIIKKKIIYLSIFLVIAILALVGYLIFKPNKNLADIEGLSYAIGQRVVDVKQNLTKQGIYSDLGASLDGSNKCLIADLPNNGHIIYDYNDNYVIDGVEYEVKYTKSEPAKLLNKINSLINITHGKLLYSHDDGWYANEYAYDSDIGIYLIDYFYSGGLAIFMGKEVHTQY